jgi:carbonic anhydrase
MGRSLLNCIAHRESVPVEKFLEGSGDATRTLIRNIFFKGWPGQRPKARFTGCADSRIDPGRLTQTKPGDQLECRVIGNAVPA